MKIYTADNEFPDCGSCDHICDDSKFYVRYCGAEHGWAGYQRTEILDDNDKNLVVN